VTLLGCWLDHWPRVRLLLLSTMSASGTYICIAPFLKALATGLLNHRNLAANFMYGHPYLDL